ncbi:hypothetical protein AAE478_007165 [Parahypoxylon ruwenzoriense]
MPYIWPTEEQTARENKIADNNTTDNNSDLIVLPGSVASKADLSIMHPVSAVPTLEDMQDTTPLENQQNVIQMLEIARESPDAVTSPSVGGVLERALGEIWGKVIMRPDSYIMTPVEYGVFNFFQHRFLGDLLAVAARARYWNYIEMVGFSKEYLRRGST